MQHRSSSFRLTCHRGRGLGHRPQVLEQPADDLRRVVRRRRLPNPPRLDPRQRPHRRHATGDQIRPAARSPCGSRPGASAISTSPSSSTCTSPAAHSRIARCAALSPCAWVRATSTTRAGGGRRGGHRPAVIGRARTREQLLERRLPRPAVRSQPPHRRLLVGSTTARAAADPATPAGPRPPAPRPRPAASAKRRLSEPSTPPRRLLLHRY